MFLEIEGPLLSSSRNLATLSPSVIWKVGNILNDMNDLAKISKQSVL